MAVRHGQSTGLRALAIVIAMLSVIGAHGANAGDGPPAEQRPQTTYAGSPEACHADAGGLFVTAHDGRSACLASARSIVGGKTALTLVVLADRDMTKVDATSTSLDAPQPMGGLQSIADAWSSRLQVGVVALARPGDLGSSGDRAREQGTWSEVDWSMSALDQLRMHEGGALVLVGSGSGGNLAATLGLRRPDVTCVVMAGAWLSELDRLAETGEIFRPSTLRATNDPISELAHATPRHGLRLIDLIDTTDNQTPEPALQAFAVKAEKQGLQLRRIALPDKMEAGARIARMQMAADACIMGKDAAAIADLVLAPPRSAPNTALPAPDKPPPGDPILPQVAAREPAAAPMPPEPIRPQSLAPMPAPQYPQPQASLTPANPMSQDPAHFSRADLLNGRASDAATCLATQYAVWVTSLGTPECIRYYYSDLGGISSRALLFLNGDFTYRGPDGQPTVDADYSRLGPADLQHVAEVRSRDYGGPMIYLARPGTLGSSGHELQIRHSPREIALVAAALDQIKVRHGIKTFDLIGHSGGGLIVGALVAQRSDIGCAVSSSGVLATNAWTSQRLNTQQTYSSFLFDPIDHVSEIHPGPGFRYIVLTDAADTTVSATSTQLYLDTLDQAGVPYLHVALSASDEAHHDLALHGFRAAIACAHGMSDSDITTILTKTVVTNRRMSEFSPLGDMPEQTGDAGAPSALPAR